MTKETNKEKGRIDELKENLRNDLCYCKDTINELCNQKVDQPDLKIGYELGGVHSVLLRALEDVFNL